MPIVPAYCCHTASCWGCWPHDTRRHRWGFSDALTQSHSKRGPHSLSAGSACRLSLHPQWKAARPSAALLSSCRAKAAANSRCSCCWSMPGACLTCQRSNGAMPTASWAALPRCCSQRGLMLRPAQWCHVTCSVVRALGQRLCASKCAGSSAGRAWQAHVFVQMSTSYPAVSAPCLASRMPLTS